MGLLPEDRPRHHHRQGLHLLRAQRPHHPRRRHARRRPRRQAQASHRLHRHRPPGLHPQRNQLQVFHAGGSQSDYQGFLTLGFGSSGADLQSKWNITDAGPETLSIGGASIATEKLNLIPKDPGMAKSFKNVEMWVDSARGIGVKEIFYTATGGNYRTATYSNIRLSAKIDKSHYGIGNDNKVKTDKSTQVFNH